MLFPLAVNVGYFLYYFLLKKKKKTREEGDTHISWLPWHCKAILISINTAKPKKKKLGGFPCTGLRGENAVISAKKLTLKSVQALYFSDDSR